jgi:hypothetical protein
MPPQWGMECCGSRKDIVAPPSVPVRVHSQPCCPAAPPCADTEPGQRVAGGLSDRLRGIMWLLRMAATMNRVLLVHQVGPGQLPSLCSAHVGTSLHVQCLRARGDVGLHHYVACTLMSMQAVCVVVLAARYLACHLHGPLQTHPAPLEVFLVPAFIDWSLGSLSLPEPARIFYEWS